MISLKKVSRSYASAEGGTVHALREVDLDIPANDFLAITGPSGCGKSTLLHLLGSLDQPTSGEIWVGGVALHGADEAAKTRYRRSEVGIVFQFFNLMPTMTVRENVALPLVLQGRSRKEAHARAEEMLALVGLGARAGHFPHQLSGGEMQRAAVARALVHGPKLVIADEPTGNLDSANAAKVLEALADIHRKALATLVVVTHSEAVAEAAARRVHMEDGRIVDAPLAP